MLTTSKRRILIFSLAYYPVVGGAEVAIKETTDRIDDIEFDMVTMRFDKAHKPFERLGNVNVYRIGSGNSYINKILFIPHAAITAWRLNRDRRYSLIWAMMTYMSFPVMILRWLGVRTRYVLTLQDGDPFERVFSRFRIKLFAPLLRAGFRHASVIQTISHFLAEWPKKLGYKGRIEVIPNGVDFKKFAELTSVANIPFDREQEKSVQLITTSRLVEKNGIRDVIDALTQLPEGVRFKILGDGPLLKDLSDRVKELHLLGRVEFLGFVDMKDIPKHLHEADIFIRPSLSEGMGNSFIEAMAAGLPVIATPVGGIPDFLFDPDKSPHHAPTGLFVNPKDPQSIAKQITRLMNDKNLLETLIANGRRLAREKYDWNLIAEMMKSRVFDRV